MKLASIDPSETYGHTKEAAATSSGRPGAADGPAGPDLGGGPPQGPRRAPGHRRCGQGRDAAPRDGRVQSAGLPGRRRSRCPRPRSWPTTTCGESIDGSRAAARSASSTGRTTRTSSSSVSTTSCRGPPGSGATTRSMPSRGCSPTRARRSSSSSCTSIKDEQRERFQARLDDPTKRWKFRLGDLEERKHWDDYIAAYEDALSRCSTEHAPWYVIPSNRKWFRNLAVAEILADTLDRPGPALPGARGGPDRGRSRVAPATPLSGHRVSKI